MTQLTQEEQLKRMVDSLSREVAQLHVRVAAAESLASMVREENEELTKQAEERASQDVQKAEANKPTHRVVESN